MSTHVRSSIYIVIILLYLLTKEGALEESWLFYGKCSKISNTFVSHFSNI